MEENLQQAVLTVETTATPKKKHGKLIALLAVLGILLLGSVAAVLVSLGVFDGVGGEAQPQSKLYWNIDGKAYVAESASGLTSRRKIGGFFDVRFFVDGEIVTHKVSDPRLIIRVDRLDLMGLVFDEEGIVSDILNLEDITGGEMASYFYVMSVDGNKVVANSMDSGSGITEEFEIPESAKIYLVTPSAEPFGQETQLYPYDRIRVILDKKGKIDTIYVVDRNTTVAFCEHCEETVMWRDWNNAITLPTSDGHWILRNDIQLGSQSAVQSGNTVVVDLNGKTVKNLYSKRLWVTFFEDGHLAIVDHSKEQTGTLKVSGTYNGQGMAVWVRYGSFKMYGGTIDCTDAVSSGSGVAVATSANATFEMHGGTIIGGEAQAMLNDQGKVLQPFGGSVYVAKNSTFDMYGGTIRDGVCKWFIEEAGTTKGGSGGNIYIASGGVMNWHDGEILNGSADSVAGNMGLGGAGSVLNMYGGTLSGGRLLNVNRNAGNLYIGAGAEFNMSGGTIQDGTATGVGGNVMQYGKMTMSGGLITGGKILSGKTMDTLEETVHESANLQNRNADLYITGGQIDGYVAIINNTDADKDGKPDPRILQISGDPKICGGEKNLTLGGTMAIDVGELTEGAQIVMSSGGFVTTETKEEYLKYFRFDGDAIKPAYLEKKIFFGKFQCDCGGRNGHIGDCDGTKHPWQPLSGKNLPTLTGRYYLIEDMPEAVQSVLAKDAIIYFDLNGHTVKAAENPSAAKAGTYNYYRVFVLQNDGTELNITDSVGGGRIVSGARGDGGMVINVQSKSTVNIYGGIIDGTRAKQTTNIGMYGIVMANKGGVINMYGGKIIGLGDIALYNKNTNTYAGKNATTLGGSVYVAADGTFNLYGGTITSGTAQKGGNVNTIGKFHMYGGTVECGNAREGANIYVGGGVCNLKGGTVANGTAATHGGNLYVNNAAEVVMTGGEIYGGKAETGLNIFVGGNKKDIKEGDKIVETVFGKVSLIGGTVYGGVNTSGNTLTLGGSIKILDTDQNKEPVSSLTVANKVYVTIEPLNEDAIIKTDAAGQNFAVLAEGAEKTLKDQISAGAVSVAADPDVQIVIENGKVGLKTLRQACLCGQTQHIGQCDGTILTWEKWTGKSLPNESGNYYLAADIENATQSNIEKQVNINLDLNGHTVTMAANPAAAVEGGTYNYFRAYALQGKSAGTMLNITDSVGGGKIVAGVRGDSGAIINLQTVSQVSLYGGILDGTSLKESTSKDLGGVVTIANGGSFTVYGGEVRGFGKITLIDKKTNTPSKTQSTPAGSAVYVAANSNFCIAGGKVVGGKANIGGAIYSVGHVTVSGGQLHGGQSNSGGALYANGGSLTVTGGSISGGKAKDFGGNLYINNATDFTMTGGEIYGGEAETGDNVFVGGNKQDIKEGDAVVDTVYGKVNLTGGTVYGGITTSGNTVTLGGSIKLTDTGKNGAAVKGLVLTSGAKVTLTALEDGAVIKADMLGSTIAVYGEGVQETIGDKISVGQLSAAIDGNAKVYVENGTVSIKTLRLVCLCGHEEHIGDCDGTPLQWQAWTSNTLPSETGNYYLTADIPNAAQSVVKANAVINLDLNGHTVTMAPNPGAAVEGGTYNSYRAFAMGNAGAVVSICDSVGGGRIVSGVRGDSGMIANITSASTLNLYGGTLDGTAAKETVATTVVGIVNVANGGSFNLYGGTVIGMGKLQVFQQSTNTIRDGIFAIPNAGAISVGSGTAVTLTGGTVYGGVAGDGDCIRLGGSVKILDTDANGNPAKGLTPNAGTAVTLLTGEDTLTTDAVIKLDGITGRAANFADSAAFAVYADQVSLGSITAAANPGVNVVAVDNTLFVGNIRVACICGGKAEGVGDHVCQDVIWEPLSPDGNGKLTIPVANGKHYYLTANATAGIQTTIGQKNITMSLDLNGHTITMAQNPGAQTATGSWNYFRAFVINSGSDGAVINLTDSVGGGKIVSGVRNDAGALIRVLSDNATFNLFGGVLDGSAMTQTTSSAAAGAVEMQKGTFNMYGGQIKGLDTVKRYATGSADTLHSAPNITVNGGAVSMSGGTFNMYGGKLSGKASNGGAVYIKGSNAAFCMYGGTIEESTAEGGKGGSVYMEGGSFSMLQHEKCAAPKIIGGRASEGGNIDVRSGATFTMQAGTVSGGTAAANNFGGNVYVNGGAFFAMSGGEIYGGSAGTAPNVFIGGNAGGSASITGGTVYGRIRTTGNTLSVGQKAQILDEEKDGTWVTGLECAAKVTILPLDSTALIRVEGALNGTLNAQFAAGAADTLNGQIAVSRVTAEGSVWVVGKDLKITAA